MRSHPTTDRARRLPGYRTTRHALPTLLLGLSALAATACDRLLAVDNPGRVPAETLTDASLIPALEAGALQQFQCGLVQYVATAGMLSGEYWSANAFVDNHPWEWRGAAEMRTNAGVCPTARTTTAMGFYTPLQQARFQLDDLGQRAAAYTDAQLPGRVRIQAEAAAYGGYAYLLLAEGMCELAFDGGPRVTRADALTIAERRFTEAIGFTGSSTDAQLVSLRTMAYVGRARARLDRNNLQGAAADAALVPAGFVRNAEYSESVVPRENRLYNLTVRNLNLSVAPTYRGLTLENGQADPRVKATRLVNATTGRDVVGPDNVTQIFQQAKYTSGAAPIPIASYAEAQLILAEATGGAEGLAAINRVRALSSIAPIAAPAADFTTLVLEERRRQLFSEGQRYGDMLRKSLPFPSGVNRKQQTYSSQTCVPLPDVETQNNPNLGS